MTRYVTIRLTERQARAASNACDFFRDQLETHQERDAALYGRASDALSKYDTATRRSRKKDRR